MPSILLRAACSVAVALVFLAVPSGALAAIDPADQPPFGGAEVPPLVDQGGLNSEPPEFNLTVHDVADIAGFSEVGREFYGDAAQGDGKIDRTIATRGPDRWEVRYRLDGELKALVVIDDETGDVVEAWTGTQIETKLARGYEDSVAGDLNEWYLWIPLCLLFVAPFVDPRRLFSRIVHLDLLALLAFSASLFFFNKGEIGVSAPLVYPVLAYLLVRTLLVGFRPDERPRSERGPLLPWAGPRALAAGIPLLAAFQIYWAVDQAKVIDVGVAGVVGADRLMSGEDVYSEDFTSELPESGDVRGDVYGPVNYLSYVPAEQVWPWEDEWDDVPAARYSSLAFSLLTALALFFLGPRLRDRGDRDGEGDRTLGLALAYAWLAYPFTIYTLGSSFNDSLVALAIVGCMLALASAPGRGALAALSSLTKFGTLALVPLFAAGTGDRRPKSIALFAVAFIAAVAVVTVPLLPDGGPRELYDRSIGYQASRGSPFSLWGQAPSLEPLQTLVKAFAAGLGIAVFFLPKRRSVAQVAALAAAVTVAVQLTANHWFYPYCVWFAPLVLAAVFSSYRTPRHASSDTRTT